MKPQWINNTFIGPFWMGSAQEMQKTQEAIENQWTFSTKTPIDEECALYEEASTHDDLIDKSINTEIGETHYDRQ